MARRKNHIEGIIKGTAKLPWWVGVLLAFISYLILHSFAIYEPATADIRNGSSLAGVLIRSASRVLQYVLPAVFVIAALTSIAKKARQEGLYTKASTDKPLEVINKMSWRDFEQFTAAAFRRRGFSVHDTNEGADGGVDLELFKGGETYLVQCKHWRSYKVGVKVVRELYGVMASRGVTGGFVVTAGEYTKEARAFAEGINIELIDGVVLEEWLKQVTEDKSFGVAAVDYQEAAAPLVTSSLEDRLSVKSLSKKNARLTRGALALVAVLIVVGAFYGIWQVTAKSLEQVFAPSSKTQSNASISGNNSKITNSMSRIEGKVENTTTSEGFIAEIYLPGQSSRQNNKSFDEWYQTPSECLASIENPNPDVISCANKRIKSRREYNSKQNRKN